MAGIRPISSTERTRKQKSLDLRDVTEPVAKMLRLKLTKLHAMNLTTDYDSKLGVCDICVCPLALKSHSPLDLILKHTNEKTMSEFPDNCWVKKRDQD